MDTAVPVLIAVFWILALHFGLKRKRERKSTERDNFLLFPLLWGGLLPGAILLWVTYG
jgi:hypothetical protein